MKSYLRSSAVFVLSILILLFTSTLNADTFKDKPQPLPLFFDKDAKPASPGKVKNLSDQAARALQAAKRFRKVSVNLQDIRPGKLIKGNRLNLNLFNDAVLLAKIDKILQDVNDVYTVRARIEDTKFGYVILSVHQDRVLGTVAIPEKNKEYMLSYVQDMSAHIIQEIHPELKDVLMNGPSLIPPEKEGMDQTFSPLQVQSSETSGQTTIDLMIVYTPAAKSWASSYASGINNVTSQTIQKSQLVLDNSQAGIDLNLVHSCQVDYTESGDSSTDLDRLTFHAGYDPSNTEGEPRYLEGVHDLRDTYKADLVCLFAKVSDVGGISWLLNSDSGWPEYGFSLIRVQQVASSYTHIHETGHNMGTHHHKDQNTQPGPGLFNYSAGWRWTGDNGGRYCSVMTYGSGDYFDDGLDHAHVPYLSNPSVNYQGVPTGNATEANNARTLIEVKETLADYRINSGENDPNPQKAMPWLPLLLGD